MVSGILWKFMLNSSLVCIFDDELNSETMFLNFGTISIALCLFPDYLFWKSSYAGLVFDSFLGFVSEGFDGFDLRMLIPLQGCDSVIDFVIDQCFSELLLVFILGHVESFTRFWA